MHPGTHAQTRPEAPAYVMAGSGEPVTYAQLDDAANRLAQLLRARGLRRGDNVAIWMENNAAYLQAAWAAHRSGLYYTAISYRLTAGEAAYILRDCEARALVTSRAQREAAAGLPDLPGLDVRLVVGGAMEGYERWEEALAAAPATPLPDAEEGMDMLYSSGTTGTPKGVKTPLRGVPVGTEDSVTKLARMLYGFGPDTVYLSPAPLYHAAPLRFTMAVHRVGGTAVIMERFDPLAFLRLVEQHRATHTQVVPTMLVRLLKLPEHERRRFDLSSLRCCIHGAAPCPVAVKEQMIDWWGPILHEYYSATESNGFTACDSDEWLAHRGTVGRPLMCTVHVLDDAGRELPPGRLGTVYFESEARFEYHNDPEKTAAARSEQGWTTLGDVGYVDEDGYLYLTDRKAYTVISGGVNVYPQEAEDVLLTHPKVLDAAVFGVPDEDLGEAVKAVVQPVDPADAGPALERELVGYCRERLAAYKCPRSIDFEAELPRHPNGKLYKRLLRDRYWHAVPRPQTLVGDPQA